MAPFDDKCAIENLSRIEGVFVSRSLSAEADDALSFRQLRPNRVIGAADVDDQCKANNLKFRHVWSVLLSNILFVTFCLYLNIGRSRCRRV